MTNISKALKETHGVELEPTDKVTFKHNYCSHNIVDVIVTDICGKDFFFEAYDCAAGCFPYN
jgi:hypothetical protein